MSKLSKVVMVFCIMFVTGGAYTQLLSLDTWIIVISIFAAMGILDETVKRRLPR